MPGNPLPHVFTRNSLLSFTCGDCGYQVFKPSAKSAKQYREDLGLRQQVRETTRGERSATAVLKQSMKSHRKYAKHVNLKTGLPFTSALDRFENDPLYRYRMMAAGWTAEMMEPLQQLLETPLLGDRPSRRTKEQIEASRTSYTTHPELGEGQTSAGNPDWQRTKIGREQFRGGLVMAQSGQAVDPEVAGLLQQHFGMDVPVIDEDGEDHPSAGKGASRGQGNWWSASSSTSWTAAPTAGWHGWNPSAAASDASWNPRATPWWQSWTGGRSDAANWRK